MASDLSALNTCAICALLPDAMFPLADATTLHNEVLEKIDFATRHRRRIFPVFNLVLIQPTTS